MASNFLLDFRFHCTSRWPAIHGQKPSSARPDAFDESSVLVVAVSLRLLPVWPCFAGWIVAVVAPALLLWWMMKIENIASHRTVGGSSRRLVGSLRGQAGSLNGSFAKCQGSSGKSTCRSTYIHLQPDSCYHHFAMSCMIPYMILSQSLTLTLSKCI